MTTLKQIVKEMCDYQVDDVNYAETEKNIMEMFREPQKIEIKNCNLNDFKSFHTELWSFLKKMCKNRKEYDLGNIDTLYPSNFRKKYNEFTEQNKNINVFNLLKNLENANIKDTQKVDKKYSLKNFIQNINLLVFRTRPSDLFLEISSFTDKSDATFEDAKKSLENIFEILNNKMLSNKSKINELKIDRVLNYDAFKSFIKNNKSDLFRKVEQNSYESTLGKYLSKIKNFENEFRSAKLEAETEPKPEAKSKPKKLSKLDSILSLLINKENASFDDANENLKMVFKFFKDKDEFKKLKLNYDLIAYDNVQLSTLRSFLEKQNATLSNSYYVKCYQIACNPKKDDKYFAPPNILKAKDGVSSQLLFELLSFIHKKNANFEDAEKSLESIMEILKNNCEISVDGLYNKDKELDGKKFGSCILENQNLLFTNPELFTLRDADKNDKDIILVTILNKYIQKYKKIKYSNIHKPELESPNILKAKDGVSSQLLFELLSFIHKKNANFEDAETSLTKVLKILKECKISVDGLYTKGKELDYKKFGSCIFENEDSLFTKSELVTLKNTVFDDNKDEVSVLKQILDNYVIKYQLKKNEDAKNSKNENTKNLKSSNISKPKVNMPSNLFLALFTFSTNNNATFKNAKESLENIVNILKTNNIPVDNLYTKENKLNYEAFKHIFKTYYNNFEKSIKYLEKYKTLEDSECAKNNEDTNSVSQNSGKFFDNILLKNQNL